MKKRIHIKGRTVLVIITCSLLAVALYSAINYFFVKEELVLDENQSYWTIGHQQPAAPALKENTTVDIAVIGGGYTGLSAAWHLALRHPDKKIILLEAKTVGNGASGRHGGMILPMLHPPGEPTDYSMQELKTIYDRSAANINKLKEIERLSGISCDLETNGILYTIFQRDAVSDAEAYVAQCRASGFSIQFLNKEEVAARLGTDRYEAAIYIPDGGSVHAMKLVLALRALVERAGVTIYENSAVTVIEEGTQVKLLVGEDNVQAKASHVVLATNAFTSKLGYFKDKVMPLHIITAATPPLTEAQLKEINWKSRLPFADSRIELYHLVLTPDNRIVVGGGYSNYYYNNNLTFKDDKDEAERIVMDELTQLYPSLRGLQFEYVWNGVIGVTMSMAEIYGITGKHNNILYALGYNGHGVNASIMYGEVLAELYDGISSPYTKTNKGTSYMLPPEPFRYIGVRSFLNYGRWSDKNK